MDAQALFVATGEQHMRRFRCVHVKPMQSEGIHEANPESHQPASLKLVSGSPDLFYQGISAEISAMCYIDALIVAGCRDGTVGIVDTNLPTLKAKFSRFRLRHDGPVLACIARLSRPLQRTTGASSLFILQQSPYPCWSTKNIISENLARCMR